MTTLHKLFKSTSPFLTIVTPTGEPLEFIGGKFHTDNTNHINFLMSEIGEVGAGKSKHKFIYVDDKETEVDPEALTPLAIMEKNMRAKLLAEMADATKTTNDRGNYDGTKNFGNSINNSVALNAGTNPDAPVVTNVIPADTKTAETETKVEEDTTTEPTSPQQDSVKAAMEKLKEQRNS